MITQELLEYVRTQMAKGTSLPAVVSALEGHGWTKGDVDEAVSALGIIVPESQKESASKGTEAVLQEKIPEHPSGTLREYFAHFSPENMLEFLLGIMIFLWQISGLIYSTYFVLLTSQFYIWSYLLHFVILMFGVALFRGAARRAQKRYIDAIVGKK